MPVSNSQEMQFFNASLAAMQLMLAAKATGWDTCAIGGFNPQALTEEFNVSSRYSTNYAYYNWGIHFKRPSCTTNERRTSE